MDRSKWEIQDPPKNTDPTENGQLAKLIENSEKQLFYERARAFLSAVSALAIIGCLVVIVPVILKTAANVDTVITQVSEAIPLAEETMKGIAEMSGAVTEMGRNMDDFVTENAETVSGLMQQIEAVDFEGLNKAIKDLGDVVEPFAKFFNRFK